MAKREPVEIVEVPQPMMTLAIRRGANHLVKWRSIEDNMGAAYLQGFHDALIASGFLPSKSDAQP